MKPSTRKSESIYALTRATWKATYAPKDCIDLIRTHYRALIEGDTQAVTLIGSILAKQYSDEYLEYIATINK